MPLLIPLCLDATLSWSEGLQPWLEVSADLGLLLMQLHVRSVHQAISNAARQKGWPSLQVEAGSGTVFRF